MTLPSDLEEVEVYESRVEIEFREGDGGAVQPLDSAFSRMGGKNVLKDQLEDWFPDCYAYVEPFMGSLKVLLNRRQKAKVEIVNDWDGDIVNFYRWIQHAPDALADLINSTPMSEALVKGFRADLADRKLKGIERAVAWHFHNSASVNATGRENYASSVHSQWSPRVDKRHFKQLQDRLRDVEIRNTSYRRIIESANKDLGKKGKVLIYMDPPYDDTAGYVTTYAGSSGFDRTHHTDLRNLCVEIHQLGNYFLQTNKYTPFIHGLYSNIDGVYLNERMVRYSVAGTAEDRKDEREIIISNFPLTSRSRPKLLGE